MEQLNTTTQELLAIPTPEVLARNRARSTNGRKATAAAAGATEMASNNADHLVRFNELKCDTYFVDFLRDGEYDSDGVRVSDAPKVYDNFTNAYNKTYPSRSMNLMLFEDAMRHLMRICRCLGMSKGCILLVGVGGSGKQNL